MSTAPLAPTPAPSNPPFEAAAWRSELQARVRDHRSRYGAWPTVEHEGASLGEDGSVAARVAERWRDRPSYNELLRASAHAAEQAAAAAEAAAEAARLTSQAAHAAAERDVFADPFFSEPVRENAGPAAVLENAGGVDPWWAESPFLFAVEHHAPLPPRVAPPPQAPFSRQPFAEAEIPPAQGLPAKLIAFPRELVASRRQRPRLAEGPLLDPENALSPRTDEAGELPVEAALPGECFATAEYAWGSIRLGEHPALQPAMETPAQEAAVAAAFPGLAPIRDRFLAALLDGAVVLAAFLLAGFLFASTAGHLSPGKAGIALAALGLAVEAAFYGWLFMRFGGGSTPGMRCARIALCTFDDENPTRREAQTRVPATALALLPLGLGVLWALLDEDRLGWHDRMTRTYQRSYR